MRRDLVRRFTYDLWAGRARGTLGGVPRGALTCQCVYTKIPSTQLSSSHEQVEQNLRISCLGWEHVVTSTPLEDSFESRYLTNETLVAQAGGL